MMPRSQLAALVVLLVGLGVVLVLVGDTGVSTGVYVAGQVTATPSPTIGPSATPLPEASADNWVESQSGMYSYADPSIPAEIRFQTSPLDELVSSTGLEAPAEDDPYPLVTVLSQLRDQLESQITDAQLTVGPDTVTGPVIEIVNGTPVNMLRATIGPQTPPSGQAFTGLDLQQMLIERTDGQVALVQYVLRGEENPTAYNDFRAWLSDNIGMLTGAESEATPAAETTPGAEESTPVTPEATEEAAAEATPEVTTEATTASAEPTAAPTEEPTAESTPEATEAASAIESTPAAEATANPAAALSPEQRWLEVQPGQLIYATNPNAFFQYQAMTLSEIAQSVGLALEGDQTPSAKDVLDAVRGSIEAQLEAQSITLDESAFEGPITEEISGVPFSYLHLLIPPHTGADGTEQPGQEMVMGLVETGEDRITAIRFAYQGDPDPTIYSDFNAWLEANIERLSEFALTEPTPVPTLEPTAEGD